MLVIRLMEKWNDGRERLPSSIVEDAGRNGIWGLANTKGIHGDFFPHILPLEGYKFLNEFHYRLGVSVPW